MAVPFLLGQRYGTVRLVSPLHLLAYLAFLGVFLKTLYMQLLDGRMFFQSYNMTDHDIMEGYLFVTGFVLLICAGYVLSIRRVWHVRTGAPLLNVVKQVRYPYFLLVLSFIVSALVVIDMLAVRGLGGLSSVFSLATLDVLNSSKIVRIEDVEGFGASGAAIRTFLFLPSLCLAVFIASYYTRRRPADLIGLLVVLALELFLTVVTGKRLELVFIIANFAIISLLLGRKVSPGAIVKAAAGLLIVISLFVVITNLRANRNGVADMRFDAAPVVESIMSSTYFLDVNVPVLIIGLSDPGDRFWGETYTRWTFAWVPRQFWPSKPAVTIGPYVKQNVLGMHGTIGGINPTGPGEAFLNFGWLGIFVALFIGVIYRKLEVLTLSAKGLATRSGFWAYPLVVFPLVVGTMQSSFSAAMISSLANYILIHVTVSLLRRRYRTNHPIDFHGAPALCRKTG